MIICVSYNLSYMNIAGIKRGGIKRGGSSGTFSYTVTGSGLRPIAYVSWFDAAHFANQMHNDSKVVAPYANG